MYDEVLPMFRRFQESNGIVPEVNGFYEYPKCYKTIDTEIDETLIFQDMKAYQFEMFDRFQETTIDHVRLVMKTLGKYHALSFALRVRSDTISNFDEIEFDHNDFSFAGQTSRKASALFSNRRNLLPNC